MDGSHQTGLAEASGRFVGATEPPRAPNLAPVPDPDPVLDPILAPVLAKGRRFRVRRLSLAPGEATALQSHLHRSEHWVVVEGTAEITLGVRARLVQEGEAVHIPLGQPHRLENPGRLPVTLIAVETGGYLGEDDVLHHN
ncbi:phosphomannose isomerase type II C-terminal cupin domain [Tabrizicola flagellatus]|uniref:phosphomannose isomerase type II C-terminal cupin domain n=1 Tax=Tabrizicola flagellatus TaxID=2593021 RepID=UPI002286535E|nr:phosphomannose isomerase type II C-terminal cupin domain [Tabrizicola flagellatus]